MNLTSSAGNPHTFNGYSPKFSSSDVQGCIYWDFWSNWPYQASISLEGRGGSDKRVFDSHSGLLPIQAYEAEIRICRSPADAATHDCGGWSDILEVDLVNDSAGPSGL